MSKSVLKSYEIIDASVLVKFNSPFSPVVHVMTQYIFGEQYAFFFFFPSCLSARGKDFWNFGDTENNPLLREQKAEVVLAFLKFPGIV